MNIGDMSWGITLWIDLWAMGIAGGAFFTAFLADRLSGGKLSHLFRLAVLTGIVMAMIGIILLLSHLGNITWFWHMFVGIYPESPLSLGGWILTGWMTVAGIMIVLWIISRFASGCQAFAGKATNVLSWVGFVLSILLMAYAGVLIAATTQPFWAETPMLPAVFVVSAIATGIAWLIFVSLVANALNRTGNSAWNWIIELFFGESEWQIDSSMIKKLAQSLVVVIVLELVILAIFMIWTSATGVAGATDALAILTGGALSIWFWVGLVAAGLAAPLILLAMNWNKDYTAGVLATITGSSAVLVVLGGLLLRALLLIAGQA